MFAVKETFVTSPLSIPHVAGRSPWTRNPWAMTLCIVASDVIALIVVFVLLRRMAPDADSILDSRPTPCDICHSFRSHFRLWLLTVSIPDCSYTPPKKCAVCSLLSATGCFSHGRRRHSSGAEQAICIRVRYFSLAGLSGVLRPVLLARVI